MLLMGTRQVHQQKQVLLQAPCSLVLCDTSYNQQTKQNQDHHNNWMIMEADQSCSSSSLEDSSASSTISNSSDLVDDDASSTNSSSSSSSSNSNGPLFQLSELMSQLPIKRGLSKYYEGKSQSFTSLSRAMSIDDMAKKETPYRKKMKACKSYGGGLDVKATISKKASSSSRGSFSSLSSCSSGRRGSFLGHHNNNNSLPPIPVQKHS